MEVVFFLLENNFWLLYTPLNILRAFILSNSYCLFLNRHWVRATFGNEGPQSAKMAAPVGEAGEFESWLNDRLDSLEVDREVYGAYILGILKEEESDEEKEDALQGIFSAFLVNIQAACLSRSGCLLHICFCLSCLPAVGWLQVIKCWCQR